jgi:hypothetical protein
MARCPNCGLETRREFCEDCAEYVAPPTGAPTGAPAPGPVLPGPELARPPVRRRTEVAAYRPDDVRCLECGRLSSPGRTFCRYCGRPLARELVVPVRHRRPSRWHRLRPEVVPDLVRPVPKVVVAAALVVSAAVVAAARPLATAQLERVERKAQRVLTLRYEPVRPRTATGGAAAGRPAALAIDGITNTSWAAPSATGEAALHVHFATVVDIDRLGVTQGAGEQPEAYARFARAARLALTFDDGTTATVRLADKPGFQSVGLHARHVRWVQLTVLVTYPGTVRTHGVALSEVEFFRLV